MNYELKSYMLAVVSAMLTPGLAVFLPGLSCVEENRGTELIYRSPSFLVRFLHVFIVRFYVIH